jgi:Rieske 2Fe-2S family protein
MPAFLKTAASHKPGARTLAGEYFTAPEIFARERGAIHARLWNCVGRAGVVAQPGGFITCDVAGESLIVIRGADAVLRAFFNVCRHRGTRLCDQPAGHAETIRCPYHAWTYASDGTLVGAPHRHDGEGFDRGDYPLHQAGCAESSGFVFVSIASDPQPFAHWFAPMADRLARFGLDALRGVHRASYEVRANWKLVFQNYSECLHCPVIHPELTAVIPYQSSANDLDEGPFLGGRMDIAPPNESVTTSGRACAAPVLAGDDRRRAFYYSVMPNLLLNVHPDYVNYYLVTPRAVDRTRIDSEWLFAPGSDPGAGRGSDPMSRGVSGGLPPFNPQDAISFWETVNRQDWDIIERNQHGIQSSRYTPGPYSPRESIPAAWDREYLRLIQAKRPT